MSPSDSPRRSDGLEPLDAAIIGVSGHARLHLFIALEQAFHRRLRLRAAVVINADEEATLCAWLERIGCRVLPTVEALWRNYAGQIALCFIPTGIHLHAEMTIRALASGAHVLVEKPLAATPAQVEAVAAAERAAGRRVFVAYQDMYAQATHAIKRRLCAGEIGTVTHIIVTGLWPRGAQYYGRNRWAGRLQMNGEGVFDSPLNNAFAHYLTLALFWSGLEADKGSPAVRLEAELYRARPIESFDTAALRLTTASGVEVGMFVTHGSSKSRDPQIVIKGQRGHVTWTMGQGYEITRRDLPVEQHSIDRGPDGIFHMGEEVVRLLGGDLSAPYCGIANARLQTDVIAALHANCPIHDIPGRFITPSASGGFLVIDDIEQAIERAAQGCSLFSEIGIAWAQQGGSWSAPSRPAAPEAGAGS